MLSIEEFIDRDSRSLRRSAWLLTGNWASAEDLVQTALLKSWRHWDAIKSETPELYVRRVLMNTFLSGQRRRWMRERPVAELPDQADVDAFSATELRQIRPHGVHPKTGTWLTYPSFEPWSSYQLLGRAH